MITTTADTSISRDRLRELTAELHQHAPRWATRLIHARSDRELLLIVKDLCNLSHAIDSLSPSPGDVPPPAKRRAARGSVESAVNPDHPMSRHIRHFITSNLHQGLTLKVLAEFLGYSDKYCSDLFRCTMGISFSRYLRGARLAAARRLLATTDQSLAAIAATVGFSDQFAFSHFFKRATGTAPLHFRQRERCHHPAH